VHVAPAIFFVVVNCLDCPRGARGWGRCRGRLRAQLAHKARVPRIRRHLMQHRRPTRNTLCAVATSAPPTRGAMWVVRAGTYRACGGTRRRFGGRRGQSHCRWRLAGRHTLGQRARTHGLLHSFFFFFFFFFLTLFAVMVAYRPPSAPRRLGRCCRQRRGGGARS
jgi:hypothetical protein